MIFRSLLNTMEGMQLKFSTTWGYGYDFILDAVTDIIKRDFSCRVTKAAVKEEDEKKFTDCLDELAGVAFDARKAPVLSERHDEVILEGESNIMKCTLQFHFFCDRNYLELTCREKGFIRKKGKHSFDIYMDSLEINAYCRDARRRALEKGENEEMEPVQRRDEGV